MNPTAEAVLTAAKAAIGFDIDIDEPMNRYNVTPELLLGVVCKQHGIKLRFSRCVRTFRDFFVEVDKDFAEAKERAALVGLLADFPLAVAIVEEDIEAQKELGYDSAGSFYDVCDGKIRLSVTAETINRVATAIHSGCVSLGLKITQSLIEYKTRGIHTYLLSWDGNMKRHNTPREWPLTEELPVRWWANWRVTGKV